MHALLFLVPIDRDKRIDRHIDYFGGGALGGPQRARSTGLSPLDTKV